MNFTPFFKKNSVFQAYLLLSQIFWNLRNYSFALFLPHLFPSKYRGKLCLQLASREREATGGTGPLDRGKIALVNRVTHGMSLLSFLLLTKAFISVVRLAVTCEYEGLTLSPSFLPNQSTFFQRRG